MPGSFSVHSKRNLTRDRRVLGKRWKSTYKGYFARTAPMRTFSRLVLSLFPKRENVRILYAGSGPGMLGERLVQEAKKEGTKSTLTLLDMSAEHLRQNTNPKTRKIVGDILTTPSPGKFDVVMMRSSLDYFSNPKLQVRALKRIRQWISPDGLFVNQAASMGSIIERNLADSVYRSNGKIGNRHFQCDVDIRDVYSQAGFNRVKLLGHAQSLVITEREHVKRYGMTQKEVERIRKKIAEVPEKKRPNIKLTKTGYRMTFLFPIYAAWK